jgi:diaminohydroxyphosphoribosylaminopyrimidine deaminase/5-amino-6-(5-phosphoribosylamino)uracil reductase
LANDVTKRPDIDLVRRSLDLARLGVGLTSPNPLVGCVIVSADGRTVGEGTYTFEGVTHAELIALQQAGSAAKGGSAYVSLEPHSHHGRTSPCTDALIDAGIACVVAPIEDPNPLVSGRGFQRLREAGIEVKLGLLAEEATRLNEKFICWHKEDRPFVHLKLATSLDGRIAVNRSVSTAFSGDAARFRVQEFRHEHDAILVGGNTAAVDDPSLTDRSGLQRRRPLVRVILDNRLQMSPRATLVTTANETPTVIFTNSSDADKVKLLKDNGVEVIQTERGSRDLLGVLEKLKEKEIQSILVEGGSEIAGAFVDARLVDKVTFIMTPVIIGGADAPVAVGGHGSKRLEDALRLKDIVIERFREDVEITGYPSFE